MDAEIGRLIVAAVLSFAGGAALTLWLDRVRAKRDAIGRLRALRREIEENIARLGPLDGSARGFPRRTERRAYDAVDGDSFPAPLAAALAAAYVEGAEVNNRAEIAERNLTAGGGAIDASTTAGYQAVLHQRALSEAAVEAGKAAMVAFEKARDELAQLTG